LHPDKEEYDYEQQELDWVVLLFQNANKSSSNLSYSADLEISRSFFFVISDVENAYALDLPQQDHFIYTVENKFSQYYEDCYHQNVTVKYITLSVAIVVKVVYAPR
jgi:hypothetical protein